MQDLAGKTAFVTGGASGIGLGMTVAFLDAGMNVMIADIRDEHLASVSSLLSDRGGRVAFQKLDVGDRDGMATAAQVTQNRYGPVHLLCNNAGIGIMAGAKEASYADWDWSLRVNLDSVFNGIHCFLPGMLAHGEGGHIVNTSSVAAILPANIVYAAAKCAVMGLSEGLRAELEPDGIGVTCLLPGPTATNIHEIAKLRPEQFSDTQLAAAEEELLARPHNRHWLDPMRVGEMVVDAVRRNLLFVFTHSEHKLGATRRFDAILAAFPPSRPGEEDTSRLGFRVANPMYEEILGLNAPPARHALSDEPVAE
jgi:NAD(P)-dependent dehydrogenase (short-subunit alcohol dehydrogenase family)